MLEHILYRFFRIMQKPSVLSASAAPRLLAQLIGLGGIASGLLGCGPVRVPLLISLLGISLLRVSSLAKILFGVRGLLGLWLRILGPVLRLCLIRLLILRLGLLILLRILRLLILRGILRYRLLIWLCVLRLCPVLRLLILRLVLRRLLGIGVVHLPYLRGSLPILGLRPCDAHLCQQLCQPRHLHPLFFLARCILAGDVVRNKHNHNQRDADGYGHIYARRILNVIGNISQIGNGEHHFANNARRIHQRGVHIVVGITLCAETGDIGIVFIRDQLHDTVCHHRVGRWAVGDDIPDTKFLRIHLFNINQ